MKRKLLVAIPILVIMAIIIVILILTRDKGPKGLELLADSGYPISFTENGAELRVTLDGSKTKDFVWSVKAENEDMITVKMDGEEKKGMATYVISPGIAGLSNVEFIRTGTVSGMETTAVSIIFPVLVYDEEGQLTARYAEEAYVKTLNETGGASLEYPYLLENREDGTAVITFPKGESDWVFIDPDGVVGTNYMAGTDGEMMRSIYRIPTEEGNEPEETAEGEKLSEGYMWGPELGDDGTYHLAQVKNKEETAEPDYYDTQKEKYKGHSSIASDGSGSTVLLAISKSQDVTEFINVKIDSDDRMTITLGKEPKE